MEADIYAPDTHVAEGVVITLDQYADRSRAVVARDVYIVDVAVRRAAVGPRLDVYARRDILYRGVTYDGLAAAVDGYTLGYAAAVDDAAREVVVAARGGDVVGGILAAETYHRLIV